MTARVSPPSAPTPAADPAEGYRLEDQVGFALRRAHQRATGIFNAVMAEFDVTPTQFAALAKLYDLGPVSQNELGRHTAMDPATIWGVVSRLIKRGYVVQATHPDDARLVMLDLSETGRAETAAMRRRAADVSRKTLAGFTARETQTLLALLQRIG